MSEIDAVIFDWDGVVADSADLQVVAERSAAVDMAEELGLDFDLSEIDWTEFKGWGRVKIAQAIFDCDPEQAEAYREQVADTTIGILADVILEPVPGSLDMVRYLRRQSIPTAVATSCNRRILDASLEVITPTYFTTTVAHREALDDKPKPGPYREIMNRLQVVPERTLIIEDSISGITGARYAGGLVLGLASTESRQFLTDYSDAHMVAHDFDHAVQLIQPLLEPQTGFRDGSSPSLVV